ncbi:GntR family transcriptional regulator [Anianabacter salinae]|uniref:GntR family transcriptional regulator n=1 Tax=Anianabacter salinae TaxID=2851023 RepID=UPI00225E354D|nr:GntR family transcriptional regulator [Anianabacter salinae]MBV0911091.1 GntR family transcriptional regulator [Anianabacter salinae]
MIVQKPTTSTNEPSATQAAYTLLRKMILTGELPAGEKLKIEKLRGILGTGASPVREALSLLTSDMLVERIDQKGFRAASASLKNFREILSLRCTMEDMALRQSVERATPDWEESLVLAHHRMQKTDRKENVQGFEEAHKVFHMQLLNNADSPVLLRFCSQLYDLNIRYRYLAAESVDYRKRNTAAEHRSILDAALRGDAEASAEALLDHYKRTGSYLEEALAAL